MLPATSQQLMDLIRRSELASESVVDRWNEQYLSQDIPLDDFCECLRKEAVLSDWQLSQLLEGKSRGFFLGKYKIIRQLGAGAMGAVFLAEHRQMKHHVAIKVLARRLLGKDRHLLRFEKEAQAAVRVNHPRIVRAFDLDHVDDIHFLVMEYVDGQTLQHLILREGPLSVPLAISFTRQIAEGLAAAHQGQLIHRDIKPANILIDPQKQVHILDLGLARILDDDEESSLTLINGSRMIGTVDYLAPEQAMDCHHIDGRADLYSLGCTLFYMLTGQPPFADGTIPQRILAHQSQLPRDLRDMRSDCPADLSRICFKLLAKSPADRYASASALIEAIDLYLAEKNGTGTRLAIVPEVRITPPSQDDSLLQLAPEDTAERVQSGEWKSQAMANRSAILAPRTGAKPANTNSLPKPLPKKPSVPSSANPLGSPDLFGDLDSFMAASSGGATSWNDRQLAPALSFSSSSHAGSRSGSGSSSPGEGPAVDAMTRARGELAERGISWRDRLLQMVAERGDGPGGLSYSLWFLIFFGVVSGLTLAGVILVTVRSLKTPEIKQQNFETPQKS